MIWYRVTKPLSIYTRQSWPRSIRPTGHILQCTLKRSNSSNPQNTGQYTPDPTDQNDEEDNGKGRKADSGPTLKSTILRMLETAATTAASIAILGYDYFLVYHPEGDPIRLTSTQ